MSANRTVSDFKVKSIKVQMRVGRGWRKPTRPTFDPGRLYRLKISVGNADGRIRYADEQFRKDNVDVRVVAKGFRMSGYHSRSKIEFYEDATFQDVVPGAKYRTSFQYPQYETHHADSVAYAYFRVKSGVARFPILLFKWDVGVYASVRNRRWRVTGTTV